MIAEDCSQRPSRLRSGRCSPQDAWLRAAPVRHRDRRRLRSRHARARARPRRRGWEVEILTPARVTTTPGTTSTRRGTSTRPTGSSMHRFPVEGAKPSRAWGPHRGAHRDRAPGCARRPARMADDGLFRVPTCSTHLVVNTDRYDAVIVSRATCSGRRPRVRTVVPERTIVMPCLHDEPEAYLEISIRCSRSVAACGSCPSRSRSSRTDRSAAARPHEVIGSGLHVPDRATTPTAFRAEYGIEGRFVLFAGRREGGKGWERLLDAFAAAQYGDLRSRHDRRERGRTAPDLADRVLDLGFLDDHRGPRHVRSGRRVRAAVARTRASRARSWRHGSRARP